LKIDPQRSVEGELKGLVLLLTHSVEASAEFVLLSKPHECVDPIIRPLTGTSKKEMWDKTLLLNSLRRCRKSLQQVARILSLDKASDGYKLSRVVDL
jgi:hypothetical protein